MLNRKVEANDHLEITCPAVGKSCKVALRDVRMDKRGNILSYTLSIDGSPADFVIPARRKGDSASPN